jgi:hypothetical protein
VPGGTLQQYFSSFVVHFALAERKNELLAKIASTMLPQAKYPERMSDRI